MNRLRGIVLDLEGVVHVGWTPLQGAAQAVADLGRAGLELAVLTNTTGASRAGIAARLDELGIDLPAVRIVTAASATADFLTERHPGARVYALVEEEGAAELRGVRLVDDPSLADVVVLGGPSDAWTYRRVNAVFRAVLAGAALVAMQRNRWWPTPDGPSADAGLYVAGLEYATRAEATVVGKPSAAIYRAACERAGVHPAEAMMVGDDLESDLLPARAAGLATCLVRTGKGASFAPGEGEVDLVLDDLAALPRALAGR